MAPADVDPSEVTALLSVPPEEFVAARTARVKELKAEGRKAEAAALATIRKPVRLVWIVGELARRHPDVATSAAEVAEELEDAQSGGGGVRPLLKRFRDVVGRVAGLADEVEGTVDSLEVGLALREVLADPRARAAWIDGRLLALPGDEDEGEDDEPADELAPRRAKKAAARKAAAKKASAKKASAKEAAAEEGTAKDADDEAAAEAARKAEEEARAEERRRAEEAVDSAAAELEEAESARTEQVARLQELEQQLERLEIRVDEARQRLEDDDAATEELRAELERARTALADLPPGPKRPTRRRR